MGHDSLSWGPCDVWGMRKLRGVQACTCMHACAVSTCASMCGLIALTLLAVRAHVLLQMSDIEKRKLSLELSELHGDQLLGVLDVLQVRCLKAEGEEGAG